MRRRHRPEPDGAPRRRGGPPGEAHWWDDNDQAFAESELLTETDVGPGWRRFPMLNNVERLDPYGGGADADQLRRCRDDRRLTALDEGTAWRRRRSGALLVARHEVFAEPIGDHRERWQALARSVLATTWRDRWIERDRAPGWIEATWLADDDRPDDLDAVADIDWLRLEDHTGSGTSVTVYDHVTVWADRYVGTLTLRRSLGVEVDPGLARAADILAEAWVSRRSGAGPASA